jgi:epoxyqueuosine reductase QueG
MVSRNSSVTVAERHFTCPAKQNERFRARLFHHMPAICLTGQGMLGLNGPVLTPGFVPSVYLTSITTDCQIPRGKPMEQELCTRSALCVENCPVGAIDREG